MLGSAMAHAVMTLFTKQAGDTLVFRAITIAISALIVSPVVFLFPFPGWEVWFFPLSAVTLTVTAITRRRAAFLVAARASLASAAESAPFNVATYGLISSSSACRAGEKNWR
jgi:hypothetical protein